MSQGFVNPYTYATSAPTVTTYTSGSGTYTTPAGVKYIVVELVGGGGGGGGGSSGAGQISVSAGGGAGAYLSKVIASPSATYSYAVGAGGTGGVGAANGSNGGNTTFGTLTAGAGFGASFGAATATSSASQTPGQIGGTATNGDINVRGGPGGPGMNLTGQSSSGFGGNSVYGGGGNGIAAAATNGVNGGQYGAGGSGSVSSNSTTNGGAGAAGIIIIYEYYEVLGIPATLTLPLAVAQGGTGVVTSTGTGSTVLSNTPTLTTPRMAQINDTNGNANLAITGPASPVNYWTSVSSATGGLTGFEVTGTDTNANGYIKAKGDAGIAIISSAVAANPLVIYSGTAQQHLTAFAFSNTAQTRVVTFPDATGTVAFTSDVPAAATQANQETATSTTTYVSPGRQQFHPSASKMWCYATYSGGTPVNNASYNQSSITDTGTGVMTHNFTVSFSSNNYVPIVTRPDASNLQFTPSAASLATGSCQSYVLADTGVPGDLGRVICCFGDQ